MHSPSTAADVRLSALSLQSLDPDSRHMMEKGREIMGFLPNDGLTMARVPGLLSAMLAMASACYRPGEVSMDLKRLLGLICSQAAGCVYCQHHARFGSLRADIPEARLDALWRYEESEQFDEAERAALRVAHHAALQPNQVSDRDFASLKQHYTEDECAEIVAVVAFFGFLNRWNDTIKTEPENLPVGGLNKD